MAFTVTPATISTFPGGRIIFSVVDENSNPVNLTTLAASIDVSFPNYQNFNGKLEANGGFSIVVPSVMGTYSVTFTFEWANGSDVAYADVTVDDISAAPITITTNPTLTLSPPVNAIVHDPTGTVVGSYPMTVDANGNYTMTATPDAIWKDGLYTAVIRDTVRNKDIMQFPIENPDLASAPTFWILQPWMQEMIQYLKFDWMGDTAPLPPAAWLTLEQYARHWVNTTEEINLTQPSTNFAGTGAPREWAQVVLKGTSLRVFDNLANRSVSVPRWTGVPIVMQDESHLQKSWEDRRDRLKPEYDRDKIRLKRHYLPHAQVTVDPFLGYVGGSLSGTARLALMGRPSWFVRSWTGR